MHSRKGHSSRSNDAHNEEDQLRSGLNRLERLKAHPLRAGSGVRAGPRRYMKKGHVPLAGHREFCPYLLAGKECRSLDDPWHLATYVHECPHGQTCPLLRDVSHCLSFWHVLPQCGGRCRYPCPLKHVCEAGLACEEISNPVHQQLFVHNETDEASRLSADWLVQQDERARLSHARDFQRDTIVFGRFPSSPFAHPTTPPADGMYTYDVRD